MSNLIEKTKQYSASALSGLYAVGAGGTIFGSLYFMLPHDPILMLIAAFAGLVVTYVNWHMCKKRVPEAWKTILSKDGLWTYTDENSNKQSIGAKKTTLLFVFAFFAISVAILMALLTWQACDYFAPGSTVFSAFLAIVVGATLITEIGLMMKSISDMLKGNGFMKAIKKIQQHFEPAEDATPEAKKKLKIAKYITYTLIATLSILGTAGLLALCFAGKKASTWALNKIPNFLSKAGNSIAAWTITVFSFFGNAPFVADTLTITGSKIAKLSTAQNTSFGQQAKTACTHFFKHHWKVMLFVGAATFALTLGLLLGTPTLFGSPEAGVVAGETLGATLLFALFAGFVSKEAHATTDEPSIESVLANATTNGAMSGPASINEFGLGIGIAAIACNSVLSGLSGMAGIEDPEEDQALKTMTPEQR